MSPAALVTDTALARSRLCDVYIAAGGPHCPCEYTLHYGRYGFTHWRSCYGHQSVLYSPKRFLPRQNTKSRNWAAIASRHGCVPSYLQMLCKVLKEFWEDKELSCFMLPCTQTLRSRTTLGVVCDTGSTIHLRAGGNSECRRCACRSQPIRIWRIRDHPDSSWDQRCTVGNDSTGMITLPTTPPQLFNVVCDASGQWAWRTWDCPPVPGYCVMHRYPTFMYIDCCCQIHFYNNF